MDSILEVRGATKIFGGLAANSDISFDVPRHSVVGIVGPNGAGKTTLFNSISGAHPLTSGKILFDGTDITKLKAYDVCRLGMGRTFQIPQSLNEMTVLENVLVAGIGRHKMSEALLRAEAVLEDLGLGKWKDSPAGTLNVVQKKHLEIARAVATEPKLLLLDETMAGLAGIERVEAVKLIKRLNESGITILMIEHVMEVVMNVSDKVVVLDGGKLLTEGTPEEIGNHEDVIRAYLGGKKW
ncbi:MAG: ABC transporter ATP-binding protein [Lachnospiraceae bacterium]|nr:ABC transporter ATP-binding protein [Lachnospiraceae bacterium]